MKQSFTSAQWCIVAIAICLFARSADAQDRVVKLTVNVLSSKNQPVPAANLTITPDAGSPIRVQAGADGSATTAVSIGKPRLGESLLSRWQPSINIAVEKDGHTGSTVVSVSPSQFKTAAEVEIIRTVTLSPPPAPLTATSTTRLTVTVVDESGAPVRGASVALSRDLWGPDSVLYDNRMETGQDGVASTDIQIKGDSRSFGEGWLYSPTFDVEVRKDELAGKDTFKIVGGNTPQGYRYPQYVARSVIVRSFGNSQAQGKQIINVSVDVSDDGHTFVEGAHVLITDPNLGAASGKFPGVTGADGRVTIPVWWASASPEQNFGLEVSKSGYRDFRNVITLNNKQVGTTAWGGSITLEKLRPDEEGVTVSVKVLNKKNGQGVADATVVLDGGGGAYYSEETNGQGDVVFNVTETGKTFAVRITHSAILPFSDEIRLLAEDKNKQRNFTFKAEGKDKADQGEDTLEVTVVGKESGDDKATTAPVAGAEVRSGAIVGTTGRDGTVPLHGAFQGETYLTVRADGYKTQVTKLTLKNDYKKQMKQLLPGKVSSILADSWKTRIVLEPELSDSSPIRLLIEVRDRSDKAVAKAKVDLTTINGDFLAGNFANDNGNFEFNSAEVEHDISLLRQGIKVTVKRQGFNDHESTIGADLLKASTATRTYHVQLDLNWDELRKAIDALEPRVLAWNNNLTALHDLLQGIPKLQAEVTKIGQRATTVSNEIDQMRPKFSGVNGQTTVGMKCEEAAKLKKNIEDYSRKASEKEQAMRKALDEAKQLSASCAKAGDAEQIRKLHDQAIKLAGEIGGLEKKAVKDSNSLKDLAKDQGETKDDLGDLKNKINDLAQDADQAEKVAESAGQVVIRAQKLNDSLKSGYLALLAELDKLKKTFGLDKSTEGVPPDLLKRVDTMEKLLAKKTGDVFSPPSPDLVHSIQAEASAIKNKEDNAEKILSGFTRDKRNTCDIDSMDDTADSIGNIVSGSVIELGAAADLPAQANDCAKKVADAANEVEVPDLSILNDLGAMTRAADQAGMVLAPVATNSPPPRGSQRLFGPQNPPAKSKAKRRSPLTIIVYQKLVEQATPTPSGIAVVSPSPKPTADDEITVPDVSKFKDGDAMLAGAGPDMVGMLIALKDPPPAGKTGLFSHQDPPSNTKSKRGQPLMIYIYQAIAAASASASPNESPSPAVATKKGTMPNLRGKTIEQASGLLPSNCRIGSDEIGDKPKTASKALTIYHQYPPPGQNIAEGVSVSIWRFGSADSTVESTPAPNTDSSDTGDTGGKGATDITNTTGGKFWGGTPRPTKKSSPAKKQAPPVSKKKKTSDWWKQHGHDRPDYEVPNN